MAGTQEEVISVGQDDLRVEFAGKIALHDALYRGLRANRHKDGSFDDAVRGVNPAGTSAGVGALGDEFETHYFTVSNERSNLLRLDGRSLGTSQKLARRGTQHAVPPHQHASDEKGGWRQSQNHPQRFHRPTTEISIVSE